MTNNNTIDNGNDNDSLYNAIFFKEYNTDTNTNANEMK